MLDFMVDMKSELQEKLRAEVKLWKVGLSLVGHFCRSSLRVQQWQNLGGRINCVAGF